MLFDYLDTPKRRWEDNIKVNINEIGWNGVDWIYVTQVRDRWWDFVNTIMKFRFL
jgi:hypothetical protein